MKELQELLALVWAMPEVRIMVSHILVNVVVALAAAQKTGEISLAKLGEFLTKKLLPYVTVYAVVRLFGENSGLSWIAPVCWTTLEATLIGDLTDNLDKLGLRMPEFLKKQ